MINKRTNNQRNIKIQKETKKKIKTNPKKTRIRKTEEKNEKKIKKE